MDLARLVAYLDDYLRVREVPDAPEALNGLQVANGGEVTRVAAAVDLCEATVGMAAEQGADLLLVHHGRRGLDDRPGCRRRARHVHHGRGRALHLLRRGRAAPERLLRRALRHGNGGRAGARRAPGSEVRPLLDVPRPSHGLVSPRRVLGVLAAAELCGMAPWFSASAVAPTLSKLWRLEAGGAAWLTISVQLGFVAGALVSAALAAAATFGVAFAPGPAVGIALRVLTGAALAGVYPPGMKIAAGWFRDGRGLAIGVLVGALTLGSAVPH